MHNRKREWSVTGYAIYNTYRLKITPFELHHGRKPRTELTNIVKDGKTYLSNWSELRISAPTGPKIPIYVGRDTEGEITNHMVMAKTNAEEKQLTENQKKNLQRRKIRLDIHSNLLKKNTTKNHWKGDYKIKYKPQLAEPKVP